MLTAMLVGAEDVEGVLFPCPGECGYVWRWQRATEWRESRLRCPVCEEPSTTTVANQRDLEVRAAYRDARLVLEALERGMTLEVPLHSDKEALRPNGLLFLNPTDVAAVRFPCPRKEGCPHVWRLQSDCEWRGKLKCPVCGEASVHAAAMERGGQIEAMRDQARGLLRAITEAALLLEVRPGARTD